MAASSTDRGALVALFRSAGGECWHERYNWATDAALPSWFRVEVDGRGCVVKLAVCSNNLQGVIPKELGAITNLMYLDLSGNELAGEIPASLGQLCNLREICLHHNMLCGAIPEELGSLSELRDLDLRSNRLTGAIPEALGALGKLQQIWLNVNRLTGRIPPQLGRLSALELLDLSSNKLDGHIPKELGALGKLQTLSLHTNQLSGVIPTELGALSELTNLVLSDNKLSGPIPRELGALLRLEWLRLSNNQLCGPIPTELGKLTNLRALDLGRRSGLDVIWRRGNKLTGGPKKHEDLDSWRARLRKKAERDRRKKLPSSTLAPPTSGTRGVDQAAAAAAAAVTARRSSKLVSEASTAAERTELVPFHHIGPAAAIPASSPSFPTFDDTRSTPTRDDEGESGGSFAAAAAARRGSRDGAAAGLEHAVVLGAARELAARSCVYPGVGEAAMILSVLAEKLVSDGRGGGKDKGSGGESRLMQCRSILATLEQATMVTQKGDDTIGEAERTLVEDVDEAVFELVEVLKAYQSNNRLPKVLLSVLFRRRHAELRAAIRRALGAPQTGIEAGVGAGVDTTEGSAGSSKESGINSHQKGQESIDEAASESSCLAEARRARRRRKLDELEIPADQVVVTDELLGTGGFGEVFLADLNGRNAAAKVLLIDHEFGSRRGDGDDTLQGPWRVQAANSRADERREDSDDDRRDGGGGQRGKAFLREVDAMVRLQSPHTVHLYGAVTSLPDRLILVMELLAGGNLRALLKDYSSEQRPLPEELARRIVGDVCAGMAFLHGKETVHGDLKSANVLLDGSLRARIGDFGTARWLQHTNSTALATYTNASHVTQMSLAWSAPEVLDTLESTCASDVYSFGIVVWEVLSKEVPWASVKHPRDIFVSVVVKGLRPAIPTDAPADLADIAMACWAADPEARPTSAFILEGIKSRGWTERDVSPYGLRCRCAWQYSRCSFQDAKIEDTSVYKNTSVL